MTKGQCSSGCRRGEGDRTRMIFTCTRELGGSVKPPSPSHPTTGRRSDTNCAISDACILCLAFLPLFNWPDLEGEFLGTWKKRPANMRQKKGEAGKGRRGCAKRAQQSITDRNQEER